MARFKRKGDGVELRIAGQEVRALERLLQDFLALLERDVQERVREGGARDVDPLEELVGITSAPVPAPTDPALVRLFPDAYADDTERAADYRRYHESDLREGKRGAVHLVLGALQRVGDGGKTLLSHEETGALLGSLNDLRLVLGARLDVQEDYAEQVRRMEPDDPALQAFAVYEALTGLQDGLLQTLLR